MAKKKSENFYDLLENEYGDYRTKRDLSDKGKILSIPTSSLSLDISTGVGGIPLGRFTELYGNEGSGKTTLALCISNQAIKLGFKVLYIEPENTLDLNLAERIIEEFTEENFVLMQPETMEETLEIAELGIRSGDFNLIVLDSIGALAPEKIFKDKLTDANVALLARLLTTWVQRNAHAVRNNDVAFLGINQVRDKIGAYISSFETPGGHQWKHHASLRVQLSRMADIEQGDEKIGINTRFTIKKNKLAPPYRTFYLPIIFGEGVDSLRDIVEFSTMLGVLERRGPYYKFEDVSLGIGMNNTIEYLKENGETLDKIVKVCYNSLEKRKVNEDE